jgi:hypothetical protein
MKKWAKNILIFLLAVCTMMLAGCDTISKLADKDKDKFEELSLNENVAMEIKHVDIDRDYETKKNEFDYYTEIEIEIKIEGSEQLTYYNASVTVSFSAILVTDDAPNGRPIHLPMVINLDKDGNGISCETYTIPACRSINTIEWSYIAYGTVTKIK